MFFSKPCKIFVNKITAKEKIFDNGPWPYITELEKTPRRVNSCGTVPLRVQDPSHLWITLDAGILDAGEHDLLPGLTSRGPE